MLGEDNHAKGPGCFSPSVPYPFGDRGFSCKLVDF